LFNAGATFACFQSLGISPDFSDFEKIDVQIGATCSFNSFNTLPCILSGVMLCVDLDYIEVLILQLMICLVVAF
jgi:hypothetical protein